MIKWFTILLVQLLISCMAKGQVTTGSLGGVIRATTGEKLSGAYIKLQHGPTGMLFFASSSRLGLFRFDELLPGGPYNLHISFIGFEPVKKEDIYITLGEAETVNLLLKPMLQQLREVVIEASKQKYKKRTAGPVMDAAQLTLLSATGKSISDYLLYLAGAQAMGGTQGAVSFAGQNNRFNSLYIDGAISNDVFGLSAAGTNGAQAGLSPLPVESIAELQVSTSPYDASYGNFTGAAINAVTRSGSNKKACAVYTNYNQRKLSVAADVNRYAKAENFRKLYGLSFEGPIKKNAAFYFFNIEFLREAHAQLFDIKTYNGTADLNTLSVLANSLRSVYHYNAGEVMNCPSFLHAMRAVARLDWHLPRRQTISCSFRYLEANRIFADQGDAETVHFSRDGFSLQTNSISGSIEWKKKLHPKVQQKLLVTCTNVTDDRGPVGKAFPRVRIFDGDGSIVFGTDNSSTINLLKQRNVTLLEHMRIAWGKHCVGTGIDGEWNTLHNAFIQNAFGSYNYSSMADFLTNRPPSGYTLGFSRLDSLQNDQITGAARFAVVRGGFFLNDEISLTPGCFLRLGLRADKTVFLTAPDADKWLNDAVLPKLAEVHDLHGAQAGKKPELQLTFSPRFSLEVEMGPKTSIGAGIGLFRGRVPLAWPGGLYQFNGINTGGFSATGNQLSRIRFSADPYQQWKPWELGAQINKEPLNLLAANFHLPALWRGSVQLDHQFRNGWKLKLELMASANTQVISYRNVNLPSPSAHVQGPDNRAVYIPGGRIPLGAGNGNPYDYAILLYNPSGPKGSAASGTLTLRKLIAAHTVLELACHYGCSSALQDGTSSVNSSQWRSMETVNGRNNLELSTSDFSAGYKATAFLHKKIPLRKNSGAIDLSLNFTAQSGSPFSYVYENSMVRDDGKSVTGDLLFVPTPAQLTEMIFLPATFRGTAYTPAQQREALETYIGHDSYLSGRRGRYASRNGSRTPFAETLNMKMAVEKKWVIDKTPHFVRLTATLYNVLNLLNSRWGLKHLAPNDQLALVEFAGYRSEQDLTPQYRFDPARLIAPGFVSSNDPDPAYSSHWSAEIALRIRF